MTLPEGWKPKALGSVLERVTLPVSVEPSREYREIGIRSHGKGIFHKPPVTGKSLGEKRVFWVVPDALVLNIVFAWEQAVAVTSPQEAGMIASHRFPMYRPIGKTCDVRFLLQYFKTPRGKELLELASPGGAGRNKTLGQKSFESLKVIEDVSFLIPDRHERKKLASVFRIASREMTLRQKHMQQLIVEKRFLAETLLTGTRQVPHHRINELEVSRM